MNQKENMKKTHTTGKGKDLFHVRLLDNEPAKHRHTSFPALLLAVPQGRGVFHKPKASELALPRRSLLLSPPAIPPGCVCGVSP